MRGHNGPWVRWRSFRESVAAAPRRALPPMDHFFEEGEFFSMNEKRSIGHRCADHCACSKAVEPTNSRWVSFWRRTTELTTE